MRKITKLPSPFLDPMRVAVVGCGGIGGFLAPPLVRFLEYTPMLEDYDVEVYLIDHDTVEEGNLSRQATKNGIGKNKALHLASKIREDLDPLRVYLTGLPFAMTPKQGMRVFYDSFWGDGVIVMGCVDSHASRIYIQEQLAQLPNALYVCGGNSLADGQVQVWAKTGNKQSPQIHHSHPEMQAGQDRFPDEISCSQAVTSKPQLLWANMMCANIMGAIFWQLVEHGPSLVLPRPDVKDMENEVLFDLETMSVHPIHSPSLIRKDGQ